MKPTDNLYQLVKSLSGSEKRYFRIFSKRHVVGAQNKYEMLFDAYDSLSDDGYEEDALRKKLTKKGLGKNLADDKKNLQEMIMRAMLNFHSGQSIDHQLSDLLAEEDFYRQKRLNDLRRKTIAKAKELAEKYDKQTVLLSLIEKETNMRMELEQDALYEIARTINDDKERVLNKICIASELISLNNWLFIQYRLNAKKDSPDFWEQVERRMAIPSFRDYVPGLSFNIDRTYYTIWSFYYLLRGDFQAYSQNARSQYELFDKHPHQKDSSRIFYKLVLFNYLYSLQTIGDFPAMEALLKVADAIVPLNEDEAGESFQNIVFYRQLYYMNTMKYNDASAMVSEIEAGITKYRRKVNTARELTLYSNIAISFMMLGQWDSVVYYTERILADKTEVRMDIRYEAMLHQLIARYELGQYDLLSYQLRNTQRQLSSRTTLTPSQANVMKLLQSLLKVGKDHLDELRQDADTAIKSIRDYPVIQVWLYAHLHRMTMIRASQEIDH